MIKPAWSIMPKLGRKKGNKKPPFIAVNKKV